MKTRSLINESSENERKLAGLLEQNRNEMFRIQ